MRTCTITSGVVALGVIYLSGSPDASALTLSGVTNAEYKITVGNADIPPIPPDFFGPGSLPFETSAGQFIELVPINPLPPTFDLFLPDPVMPDPTVIQLEMIDLQLQSIQPIQVVFNDGTQRDYDVFVTLDGLPPEPSSQPFPDGQFIVDSFFDIAYQIDFVDPLLELPAPGGPLLNEIPMISPPMPWFHDPVADLLVPGFDGVIVEPFEFVSPAGGILIGADADLPINFVEGDIDGDGFVGINDLNLVLSDWNKTVPPANPNADPSGDGFVGIDDLNYVLSNWNNGTPPTAASVPEPAALTVLSLMGLAMLKRGR